MELTGLPHEKSVTLLQVSDFDVMQAASLHFTERETARPPPSAKQALKAASTSCCLLLELLPEELVRRCLKQVSIANLIANVRVVNKQLSLIALVEVRDRIRGLLHDALVSGFEADLSGAAHGDGSPAAAATNEADGQGASKDHGASTSEASASPSLPLQSSHPPPPVVLASQEVADSSSQHGAVGSGGGGEFTSPAQRRELLALSTELEIALTSLAGESSADKAIRTLTSKCRSICFNLSDKSNPDLRARLWRGELTPAALVRLTPQEMASSRLRAQRDEWHAKHMVRRPDGSCLIRPERTLGMRCDLYRCDDCGSKVTRVHRTVRAGQKQVDRARTYATCVECSARWEV